MEKLTKAGHFALYALMVALPVVGWLVLSGRQAHFLLRTGIACPHCA
ncbi:MAG: hypothetical protein ACYC4S_18325 [Rhodoferax sp.]